MQRPYLRNNIFTTPDRFDDTSSVTSSLSKPSSETLYNTPIANRNGFRITSQDYCFGPVNDESSDDDDDDEDDKDDGDDNDDEPAPKRRRLGL